MAIHMVHPDAPPGKGMKYARRERERRFLIAKVPSGKPVRTASILDRYIRGTRLRLRQSEEEEEAAHPRVTFKLTQKIPSDDGGPGLITTTYLSKEEFDVFSGLPADPLDKTRLSIPPLGVDVFTGTLKGLILAEAEFDTDDDAARFSPPAICVVEVTRDQRFTGARLATISRAELGEMLRAFDLTP